MKQILFVCSGNTCRSPMAEAVFRKLAQERGVEIEVKSAGTGAWRGSSASYASQEAAAEIGADLSDFESTPLSLELMDGSDLVVGMTAGHRREILSRYPDAADKVRLLLEFDGSRQDVSDPYGGSLDLYRFTLQAMLPALERLLELIENKQI